MRRFTRDLPHPLNAHFGQRLRRGHRRESDIPDTTDARVNLSFSTLGSQLGNLACKPCVINVYGCSFGGGGAIGTPPQTALQRLAQASGCTVYATDQKNAISDGGKWKLVSPGKIVGYDPTTGALPPAVGPSTDATATDRTLEEYYKG